MDEVEIVKPIARPDTVSRTNKKSLINMIEKETYMHDRLVATQDEVAKMQGEQEFKYLLGKHKHFSTLRRLRLQFWNVYNQAINAPAKNAKMLLVSCHAGICSQPFYKKLLDDDTVATFIFTQPHDIKVIQRDILYEGYKYLEEIMMLPIVNEDGAPNDKLIAHKIKIIQMMEDRLSGSVVQRTQGFIETAPAEASPKQIDDLRAEVERLKTGLGKQIEDADFKEVAVE